MIFRINDISTYVIEVNHKLRSYNCVAISVAAMFLLAVIVPNVGVAAFVVGSAQTVVRSVEGIQQTQIRSLVVNDNVYESEKIRTHDLSATRIIFADKTDFLVGPNSDVVLNKFIYDPDPGKYNLSLRINRGLIKFKTGIMPSASYKIQSRVATLGVRGTEFSVKVLGDGTTIVYVISGVVVVIDNLGRSIEVHSTESAIVYPEGDEYSKSGPVVYRITPNDIVDEVRHLIALVTFNEQQGLEHGALQFNVPTPIFIQHGQLGPIPQLAHGWFAPIGYRGAGGYGPPAGNGGGAAAVEVFPDQILQTLQELGLLERTAPGIGENAPVIGVPVPDEGPQPQNPPNPDIVVGSGEGGTSGKNSAGGSSGVTASPNSPPSVSPFLLSAANEGLQPSFDGYLMNGDFEAGTYNWLAAGSGYFEVDPMASGVSAINHVALLTTGSPVSIAANLTTTPDTIFTILWQATFLDGAGILDVFLNEFLIGSFDAAQLSFDNLLQVTLYDQRFGNLTGAELRFLFDASGGGMRLVIDDIRIVASDLPLLVSPPATEPTVTPAPTPLALLILVGGLAHRCARRRSR